ncbi:hypothetical protein BLNAU_8460 [Blattamonas nauphoetae]|uniref:Acid phosphatase n=1 Tax=Blattamonas nauphoetae TaxID=2049346 RepID=A0ABQ9XYS8_9EUKA|nr:hypothetical protein BLNAU_8460 [Blattamonas nauphoetae]
MHAFVRHGDRNLLVPLSYDPSIPSNGLLTQKGKQVQSFLGREMQKLLTKDKVFDFVEQTHAELPDYRFMWNSTATMRTRDSIQAFTHGFFPDNWSIKTGGKNVFDRIVHPVYVYSTDSTSDYLLNIGFNCPNSMNILLTSASGQKIEELKKKYKSEITTIFKLFKETETDDAKLLSLLDSVKVAHEIGAKMPEGFTDELYAIVLELRKTYFTTFIPFKDEKYCQINNAPLFTEIFFTDFEADKKAIKDGSEYPKYRHYSCHDMNLQVLAGCLGFDTIVSEEPDYASILIIEERIDDSHPLENPRVLFKANWHVDKNKEFTLTELTPAFCNGECTMKKLQEHYKSYNEALQDHTAFLVNQCGLVAQTVTPTNVIAYLATGFIVICVGILACLLAIILLLSDLCSQRRRSHRG